MHIHPSNLDVRTCSAVQHSKRGPKILESIRHWWYGTKLREVTLDYNASHSRHPTARTPAHHYRWNATWRPHEIKKRRRRRKKSYRNKRRQPLLEIPRSCKMAFSHPTCNLFLFCFIFRRARGAETHAAQLDSQLVYVSARSRRAVGGDPCSGNASCTYVSSKRRTVPIRRVHRSIPLRDE